ncbi:phosphatase PAP2 family protein [Tuberibacillus sp. Marseille-P3662]
MLGCFLFLFIQSHVRKWIAAVSMVILVLLIGVSRIYLGVHYPSDVRDIE